MAEKNFDKIKANRTVKDSVFRDLFSEKKYLLQLYQFTEVSDEQIKLHGRTRETAADIVRICKDRDILKNYLTSREGEVTDMLTTLYDQDEVLELFIASERREAAEEAKAEAEKKAEKKVKETAKKAAKEAAKETAQKAAKQFYVNHVPIEVIAKSLEVDVETVESWLS